MIRLEDVVIVIFLLIRIGRQEFFFGVILKFTHSMQFSVVNNHAKINQYLIIVREFQI